jgi:hypothetical protein
MFDGTNEDCQNNSQVAVQPRSPQPGQSCQLNDGVNSLSVGTTVGEVNVNGQVQARSVTDVTALYSYGGAVAESPNFLYINLRPVGFVYMDNNGAYWFQKDASANWTMSFGGGVNLGSIFSADFGLTPPNDETPTALGPNPARLAIISWLRSVGLMIRLSIRENSRKMRSFSVAVALALSALLSTNVALAAPCSGTPASYGMTLGVIKDKATGAIEQRSLEAIATLSLSQAQRKPIGWMAIDQDGQAWVSLAKNAPKWALMRFHAHPRMLGDALFTPWTHTSGLPRGIFLQYCSQ